MARGGGNDFKHGKKPEFFDKMQKCAPLHAHRTSVNPTTSVIHHGSRSSAACNTDS